MSVLAVALLGLGGVSCLPQPTPHPEMRSTWPDNIFPGEECLPYDGSKVPDCSKFVDPVLKQPYYHEHSSSKDKLCSILITPLLPDCSRFWECGPELETCLFECAACCRCADDQSLCTDENGWQCSPQCNDQTLGGVQWALTFDDKYNALLQKLLNLHYLGFISSPRVPRVCGQSTIPETAPTPQPPAPACPGRSAWETSARPSVSRTATALMATSVMTVAGASLRTMAVTGSMPTARPLMLYATSQIMKTVSTAMERSVS